jgi:hypothetical protein
LAAKALKGVDGAALEAGDIESGAMVAAFYDGTDFLLISGSDRAARGGDSYGGAHDFTGATVEVATQSAGDGSEKAASTAYVDAADAMKADMESPALTGVPTAPTASAGTNTTQIATTAFVEQAAFQAALPGQVGEAGKFLQTDGTDAAWVNITNEASAKAGDYTVIATDRYAAFDLTGSHTLTLTAAATLADGFIVYVRNAGTGVWTIDADGSEEIDGRTTIKVYQGEAFALICDGAGWRTYGRQRSGVLVSETDLTGVTVAEFAAPFGDTEAVIIRWELDRASAAAGIGAQVKASGSYITSGSYNYSTRDISGATGLGVNQSFIYAGPSTTLTKSKIELRHPFSTTAAVPEFTTEQINGAFRAVGSQTGAVTIEAVRFLVVGGGNFTSGTIRCYIDRV